MEQHSSDAHLLKHLVADFRRMSLIYGMSIISLSLVITAMVWASPSFNVFPAPKIVPVSLDLRNAVGNSSEASSTRATTTTVYPD